MFAIYIKPNKTIILIMTREDAKRAAEVMLAYADGKEIEYLYDGKWRSPFSPIFDWYNQEYRIKPKKPKFDPKTLQPFDKVLVRYSHKEKWHCSLFSYINNDDIDYPYVAITTGFRYCIPYNEETKYLVGTNEEAPEFYRYWED